MTATASRDAVSVLGTVSRRLSSGSWRKAGVQLPLLLLVFPVLAVVAVALALLLSLALLFAISRELVWPRALGRSGLLGHGARPADQRAP